MRASASSRRINVAPNATHWVQHDAPERVNEEIIAFFREKPSS